MVLDQMLAQGRISEEQHREAISSGLSVTRGDPSETEANDYFLNAVRQEIIREYGQERLYQGGLDIYTTLDPELQGQPTSPWSRSSTPTRATHPPRWSP